MANCVECKNPLSSGLVIESECYKKLKAASWERDHYKQALESIKEYGAFTGYLARNALEAGRQGGENND